MMIKEFAYPADLPLGEAADHLMHAARGFFLRNTAWTAVSRPRMQLWVTGRGKRYWTLRIQVVRAASAPQSFFPVGPGIVHA